MPSLASLNLPPALAELVKPSRGLILVCGPTGSGKSSTLAAMVGEINRSRTSHIITIEDPIEYEHRSIRSVIEHVEVGRDARSFHDALRASLRQDPDVILVGEMRDLETVATALTAAETGHLVLSTLHTNDAQQAVHRVVDVFPPAQQSQIRHQLALSLHAIVVQQLVPRADGRGRVPAIELLLANYPVRHHIRSDDLQKLYNEITIGKRHGMIAMEESLALLVRRRRDRTTRRRGCGRAIRRRWSRCCGRLARSLSPRCHGEPSSFSYIVRRNADDGSKDLDATDHRQRPHEPRSPHGPGRHDGARTWPLS